MENETFNEVIDLVRAIFEIVFDIITKKKVDDDDIARLVAAVQNLCN